MDRYMGFGADIWEILGIAPYSDIETIREAYSRKVKIYHPEDDPEGFKRIRMAYTQAMQMTRQQPSAPDFSQYGATDDTPNSYYASRQTDSQRVDDTQKHGYSDIERQVEEKREEEQRTADRFFARLRRLEASGELHNIKTWNALLSHPRIEELKYSEDFTRAFLDYLASSSNIPTNIFIKPVNQCMIEWSEIWLGTPLWAEFSVINRINIVKRETAAMYARRVSIISVLVAAALPFATRFVIGFALDIFSNSDDKTELSEFLANYDTVLFMTIAAGIISIALLSMQIYCFVLNRIKLRGSTFSKDSKKFTRYFLVLGVMISFLYFLSMQGNILDLSQHPRNQTQITESQQSENPDHNPEPQDESSNGRFTIGFWRVMAYIGIVITVLAMGAKKKQKKQKEKTRA